MPRHAPLPPVRVTLVFTDPVNGPARLTAALVNLGRKQAQPATLHTAAK